MGMAYNATKDSVVGGFLDRLLFIDYNKLMSDPQRELGRIYEFFGEEPFDTAQGKPFDIARGKPFEHDLSNIKRSGESNWRVHQFPGLHDVRPAFEKIHRDPRKILGDEVYAKYYKEAEPWDQWT